MARDDGGKFFNDGFVEGTGNIALIGGNAKYGDPVENLSSTDNTFVKFRVFLNSARGKDELDPAVFTIQAFGDWAEYILDNPEVFKHGGRITFAGNLFTDTYTYDRTVETIDGEEVEFEENRTEYIVEIARFGRCNIGPCYQFSDSGGGGGRRRRRDDDDDYDDAPRSRRRSRRQDDGDGDSTRRGSRREEEADDGDDAPRSTRRRRGGDDADDAPRARRGTTRRSGRDDSEGGGGARSRRDRRRGSFMNRDD